MTIDRDALRAVSVRQPWAWSLLFGGKDVENRSRPTGYRGWLLIHASKGRPHPSEAGAVAELLGRPDLVPFLMEVRCGAIVGAIRLADCHHADECAGTLNDRETNQIIEVLGHCSRWAMPGQHHWVADDRRALDDPVDATGSLGLWRPDTLTLDTVLQRLHLE